MATQVQILRGTTAENNAFTGAVGALTYDTEKKQIRVHDGATAGGKIICNIVTDLDGTNTDDQVPSAQTVYEELETRVPTAAVLTAVDSGSTDNQVPSAKLFYDTCGNIESLINAL